ncbi:heat shock transcription factor, Y-linked-like [Vicugna pacos]|uniref:Heat shock transcription factor, Y-linked-like n=1 Tax=Vicugna pacos TaxID=30538 RepID=A0ABM5CXH9_VICPA
MLFEMAHVSTEIQVVSPKYGPTSSGMYSRSLLCDQTFSGDLDLRSMIEENVFKALSEESLIKRPCYKHCVSEPDEDNDFRSLTYPRKLWKMVGNDQFKSICWDDNGTSIVMDEDVFMKENLERKSPFRIFEPGSMKSLVRQLNLYGFSKVQQNFRRSVSLADFQAEEKEVSVLSKLTIIHGHSQSSYNEANGRVVNFITTKTSTSQYSILSPIQCNYFGLMEEPPTFPNGYHKISASEGRFSKLQPGRNPRIPVPELANTSATSLSRPNHQPSSAYERHPNYN